MTTTFDQILPIIRAKISTDPGLSAGLFQKLKAVTVIRDASGLIRLLLEPREGENIDDDPPIMQLKTQLTDELGSYFGSDIWHSQLHFTVLKNLVDVVRRDRIPASWDVESSLPRWYLVERHVAKHLWTRHIDQQLPWPVEPVENGQRPAIVTFFSFKGGIGRTTSLAGTAIALARRGHRVAMVDLDLEAPGLSSLFKPDDDGDIGVLDYLIEKRVQKNNWQLRTQIQLINEPSIIGDSGQPIRLLPAGKVDGSYLEKLARIDFQHLTDATVSSIMQDMLKELAAAIPQLDFIFLDARAGFHDLGGFALSTLSHGAVLLASQSRQNWAGTTCAIELLAQPLDKDPVPVVLVHGMAPPISQTGRADTVRKFKDKAYDIFQSHYFGQDEDIPNANDTDAPFTPVEALWDPDLRGDIMLSHQNDNPEEQARVSALIRKLVEMSEPIALRVCKLFGRPLDKGIPGNG